MSITPLPGDLSPGTIELTESKITNPPSNRRKSEILIDNDGFKFDDLLDIFGAVLPGIIFAITFFLFSNVESYNSEDDRKKADKKNKIIKFILAIIPVTVLLAWYIYKYYIQERRHKIGNIKMVVIGNAITFVTILIIGTVVISRS